MRLIGAGFGRTGTKSLQAALEELGLRRCYHMTELANNPSHVDHWADAVAGRPVDWKRLFQGYEATVDWPGCTFYKELMVAFPDAKVLLSVRDPEKWYESAYNTIYSGLRAFPFNVIRYAVPHLRRMARTVDDIIWDGTFKGRFGDKQFAIEVYNRHIEDVKKHVPAERLLVYEVKEGWEPLCRFLGVEVPKDKPFPRLNDTADFQKMIRGRLKSVLLPWHKPRPS
ncbi:sulfotransferase family protein [Archangium lansingense]|uniref:Sulfotransferase family protein n=1 Tax=Archangium lansingense TaxID=2995310 RepID=A0ABT4AEL9_9BACT|nr:sulfotransferase family protein [Archangium lansinium]MCY1079359.1 sulfotransferase family protein [Archangium lansinium]